MPSTPRKVHGNKEGMSRGTATMTDSDSDDSDLPSLIPCTSDDEDSDDEEDYRNKPASKSKGKGKSTTKAKNNAEYADMWYKLSKDEKEKHIHVMKVYLLSPFLFGEVYQDDKWINWAYECGLLTSKSSFEIRALEDKHFDAVDLIETAFNKLADHALLKNKDALVKTFDIIGSSGVSMSQHLDKAVTCAESFLAFTNLRDKIKLKSGATKKQGDVALLLAHNQVSDHIKQWADGKNLVENFNKKCKQEEDQTADKKKEGNEAFSKGKYTAAISVYTRALHMSSYNHVLYGNRAQSYLKTKDLWCALTDGRRAVVLKPEWHKAQYRYAQAFFELGNVSRAKETNRAARKICSERKDLETQFDKFEKGNLTTKEVKGKTNGNKKSTKQSNILLDDLPALVDANSSDTSRNSDDDYGVPELVELEDEDTADSTHDESEDLNSDSTDGYESDDSSARKKSTSGPAPKKRRPNRKIRQALRETAQDKAKQEEKAKREEKEKNLAKIAARKENKKVEKRNKKTKVTQVDQNGNSQQKREFNAFLKQGSKAIIEKKCVMAVRSYREAITILEQNDFQYQVFDLKEIDFVILLYGFGAACLELGNHEDLRAAKKQFEIIVLQHKNVVFPLAYLGTGRVFYKQNRFIEALQPLEEGLALVNKLGDDLASYRWPGSQVIIEETKPGKLLSAIETLIRICRHPPRPDAICRYPDCSNKAQIYLTDSDYKGYIRLVCHEECKVEFHPVCWKKQKGSQEGKAGDKDFLEDGCMTPDCGGSVVNIQIYDTDGLKTEFKSEKLSTKPETKHKATKQNRGKASVVAAKQKKKKEKEDLKIEDVTPTDTDTAEEKEPVKPAPPPPPPIAVQKEEKPFKEEHVEKGGHEPSNTDTNIQEGGGVFILRKDEDEEPTKGVGKAKTRKKKSKNTQTLDEFLKDRGGQQTFRPGFGETTGDLDEITIPKGKFDLVPPPPGWSQHEMEAPFAIPPHLHGDAAQIETSYKDGLNMFSFSPVTAPQPQIDLQAVTDYVSSMLQEILRANGPLELADPNIMQPLSMLPDNYQDIISNAGGLRPILEQSSKFLFQGNRVMLPEDKDFEDLVQKTLKPYTNNPFLERISGSNNGVKLENGIHSEDTLWNVDTFEEENTDNEDSYLSSSTSQLFNSGSSWPFNPEAKEFIPSLSQTDLLDNSSSKSSLVSDSSTLKDVELVDDQITVENENTITEEPEPVSNSAKVQEPDSNDGGEHQPVSNGADEHKPVSNGADEHKPVSNVDDEHKPASNGAYEHKPVSNGADENKPVSNGADENKPVSNGADEDKPVSNGADENKPVPNGTDENKPVSNGADENKPVPNGTDENKPVSNGADEHKVSNEAGEHKPVLNGTEEGKPVLNGTEEGKPVLNGTEEGKLVSNGTEVENVVESNSNDMKTTNGTQDEGIVDTARVSDVTKKAESVAVNAKNFEDSTCDLSQATNTVEPVVKDTVFVSPAVTEITQAVKCNHKRTGSSNSSTSDQSVVISKAKSVQTQPNVKHKGVGTDPIPEPYKAEYQRAVAERDSLQARQQENSDRHNALVNKKEAEVDKVKKKLSDALQEKEKCSKELQETKQKNLEETRKLRQQSEDKDNKIKLLNQKLQSADDKSSMINSIKKELTTCKGQFASEKDSWNKERSEKEDLLKNMKLQHQQQQSRAQEAEIKLLELRRDVGLRFLERAYQESHITINNLIQAVNARIAGPKVEELITTWKNYAAECHQRVVQCKATFNEQIELLKTGRTLASVPQLTIPGPPPYPAIPVLQSVVPGQPQQQQNQPQPLAESNTPAPRAADPPLPSASAGAAPVGPSAVVPTSGAAPAVNEDKPVTATAPAASAAVADKARPSNSFEKIMLRLSTMYPNFTRLELTVFIKEVRHNKHGSLTGLSLEDIVASVSELVEQKKKAGLLRVGPVPPTSSPTIQRTAKPATVPQKTQTAQLGVQEVSKMMIGSGNYEEDPCVICHEDMNASSDIVTLECGHRYHSPCIRKWLVGEQSTCPTCRVHALLPDEFPRLK